MYNVHFNFNVNFIENKAVITLKAHFNHDDSKFIISRRRTVKREKSNAEYDFIFKFNEVWDELFTQFVLAIRNYRSTAIVVADYLDKINKSADTEYGSTAFASHIASIPAVNLLFFAVKELSDS